jgi:hypothetical protein
VTARIAIIASPNLAAWPALLLRIMLFAFPNRNLVHRRRPSRSGGA